MLMPIGIFIFILVAIMISSYKIDTSKQKYINESTATNYECSCRISGLLDEVAKSDDAYALHPALNGGKEKIKDMIARGKGDIYNGSIRVFNTYKDEQTGIAGHALLYVESNKEEA